LQIYPLPRKNQPFLNGSPNKKPEVPLRLFIPHLKQKKYFYIIESGGF
jgi:hypothetical protein